MVEYVGCLKESENILELVRSEKKLILLNIHRKRTIKKI